MSLEILIILHTPSSPSLHDTQSPKNRQVLCFSNYLLAREYSKVVQTLASFRVGRHR
jgi:hypothetical protein